MARAPFDATEPPNGDFTRYIERLEQQAATGPAPAGTLSTENRAARSSTPGKAPLRRRRDTTPGTFPISRAAWWLIGAGAALILLAVLPDDPMIDTPLPGMVLIGAGLAIRKHFAKNRKSR